MDASHILRRLNPAQRRAVETLEGPVLVLAGAGSGKTRVLTHRVAYLLGVKKVSPRRILAVTFTNKAANEMKERLRHLLGRSFPELWVGTFHSIGVRILRQHAELLGYPRSFVIFDREDQRRILKPMLPEGTNVNTWISRISRMKHGTPPEDEEEASLLRRYTEELRRLQAFDFDDLLLKPLELFRAHPEVEEQYARTFQYIHVDEYQDTNRVQYHLLKSWSRIHRNLFAVGDEDQSIYGFRGADIRNVLEFQKDFPDATIIFLEQNYRSTQRILKAATAVIAHNRERMGKRLWTENPEGEKLRYFEAEDERQEADEVVRLLQSLKRPYSDIAVLYRTNAQSRALEEALRRAGVPYQIVGGMRFYERKEVKDVLAYLRVLVNPQDEVSLLRILNIPPRRIGGSTRKMLLERAQREGRPLYQVMRESEAPPVQAFVRMMERYRAQLEEVPVSRLTGALLEEVGFEAYIRKQDLRSPLQNGTRWDNIQELVASMRRFEEEEPPGFTPAYLESIALVTSMDEIEDAPRVTLMTVHMAKGLEYPVIVITGLEETVFPHQHAYGRESDMEEERRLFHVALTRAKEEVYLFFARSRSLRYGLMLQPSRFLREIPEEVLEPLHPSAVHTALTDMGGGEVFRVGDEVYHKVFGVGEVVALEGDRVRVRFPSGTKVILASYLSPLSRSATRNGSPFQEF